MQHTVICDFCKSGVTLDRSVRIDKVNQTLRKRCPIRFPSAWSTPAVRMRVITARSWRYTTRWSRVGSGVVSVSTPRRSYCGYPTRLGSESYSSYLISSSYVSGFELLIMNWNGRCNIVLIHIFICCKPRKSKVFCPIHYLNQRI